MSKTKELIFHRPNPRNYLPSAEIIGIERVSFTKFLGVWLQDDMSACKHVDYVTHICNQRLYLLNQIKKQGFHKAELLSVFEEIVLTRVLYASPALSGYASANNIDSLQRVLIKAKRWRIVDIDYQLVDLFQNCDRLLFSAAQSSKHSLTHLFQVKQNHSHQMSLRPRGHNF